MFRYSSLKKIKVFINRKLFRVLFAGKFKYFGTNVSIVSPDIIEGEEYISLANNVSINSMCWLLAYKQLDSIPNLEIGEHTTIGRFFHVVSLKNVVIEDNVLIADKVYISDNIHQFIDISLPIKEQPIEFKKDVKIGSNSWIGENVSIIGASIGKHCIVGANSVVTKDIPDYSVVVGSPAKIIKQYNKDLGTWDSINESNK